jgi:hypothetical protein
MLLYTVELNNRRALCQMLDRVYAELEMVVQTCADYAEREHDVKALQCYKAIRARFEDTENSLALFTARMHHGSILTGPEIHEQAERLQEAGRLSAEMKMQAERFLGLCFEIDGNKIEIDIDAPAD